MKTASDRVVVLRCCGQPERGISQSIVFYYERFANAGRLSDSSTRSRAILFNERNKTRAFIAHSVIFQVFNSITRRIVALVKCRIDTSGSRSVSETKVPARCKQSYARFRSASCFCFYSIYHSICRHRPQVGAIQTTGRATGMRVYITCT